MIHMRSEIAQSLTWVPPKQRPWTLNLGFSCIGRGLKQSARSSEEVPAECGNQYESIFSQLTPTNLFSGILYPNIETASVVAVFHISLKSQRIPMWAPNHKHLFIASSCGSQVEPKGSWKPSGRRRVELCSSLFIKMVMVMELEENMAPIGVIFV